MKKSRIDGTAAPSNGSDRLRVKMHKDNAIKELNLMHKAIEQGDYKRALHHKIIANIAIDEMMNISEIVEKER
jgi:hypothetical protein